MSKKRFSQTTIVFDLDGTLIDTAPDLVAATNHVLTSLSLPELPSEALRPWISFGAVRMIVEALATHGLSRPDGEHDALLEKFLDYYEANIARCSRPFPHALEAIESLKAQGARVAICTNKREALSLKLLGELGLTDHFAAIVGRDTLDVCKPDPGHLTGTIERAGGHIGRAIMVGDSQVDVATARAAGIPVVGVTFGYTDTPMATLMPDALIDSFAALNPVLAELLFTDNIDRSAGQSDDHAH